MSLRWDYQLYDFSMPREYIQKRYTEEKREIFARLESSGLTVEMWYHKSKDTARVRVYHPHRALDVDEVDKVDTFYCVYNGGSCGYGFLDEVSPPNSADWELVYKSSPNAVSEAEGILASVPPDPDRSPSKAEVDLAVAAADLNEKYKDTGGKIRKMQVDAAVRNTERVARLVKSGKFRILGVDTWDYGKETVFDFDTEEDALMYVWLERQQESPETRTKTKNDNYDAFLDLWHQCLWLDRNDGAKKMREFFGIEDKKLTAQDIEPGVTIEELKKRLAKNYRSITSEIDYLYDPDGNCIGKYPI